MDKSLNAGQPPRPSPDPRKAGDASADALHQAMSSMYGHATFALLGNIHDIACSRFGFRGSLEDALRLLEASSAADVVPAPRLEDYQIKSTLWHPHQPPGKQPE